MDITCANLEALLQRADLSFSKKIDEYQIKIRELDNVIADRKKEILNIISLLESQKDLIQNSVLKQRFETILSGMSGVSAYSNMPDYRRFLYYIQRLNEMEHPEYVLKYNSQYCQIVLHKIANEYALMRAHLDKAYSDLDKAYKHRLTVLFNEYAKTLMIGYEKASKQAIQIAQVEANRIISELKSSI